MVTALKPASRVSISWPRAVFELGTGEGLARRSAAARIGIVADGERPRARCLALGGHKCLDCTPTRY